jgi:hypothetical protein
MMQPTQAKGVEGGQDYRGAVRSSKAGWAS